MKTGANFSEINAIKRRALAGESAEHISQRMNIHLQVVQSFLPEDPAAAEKAPSAPKASRKKSKAPVAADTSDSGVEAFD
jgi:hypothetical protein